MRPLLAHPSDFGLVIVCNSHAVVSFGRCEITPRPGRIPLVMLTYQETAAAKRRAAYAKGAQDAADLTVYGTGRLAAARKPTRESKDRITRCKKHQGVQAVACVAFHRASEEGQ